MAISQETGEIIWEITCDDLADGVIVTACNATVLASSSLSGNGSVLFYGDLTGNVKALQLGRSLLNTTSPTDFPTGTPSSHPSTAPSSSPSDATLAPSIAPTSLAQTSSPSQSSNISSQITNSPSWLPSMMLTQEPTMAPNVSPTPGPDSFVFFPTVESEQLESAAFSRRQDLASSFVSAILAISLILLSY